MTGHVAHALHELMGSCKAGNTTASQGYVDELMHEFEGESGHGTTAKNGTEKKAAGTSGAGVSAGMSTIVGVAVVMFATALSV